MDCSRSILHIDHCRHAHTILYSIELPSLLSVERFECKWCYLLFIIYYLSLSSSSSIEWSWSTFHSILFDSFEHCDDYVSHYFSHSQSFTKSRIVGIVVIVVVILSFIIIYYYHHNLESSLISSEIFSYHANDCSLLSKLFSKCSQIIPDLIVLLMILVIISVVWTLYANSFFSIDHWLSSIQVGCVALVVFVIIRVWKKRRYVDKIRNTLREKERVELIYKVELYRDCVDTEVIASYIVWLLCFAFRGYYENPSFGQSYLLWIFWIMAAGEILLNIIYKMDLVSSHWIKLNHEEISYVSYE